MITVLGVGGGGGYHGVWSGSCMRAYEGTKGYHEASFLTCLDSSRLMELGWNSHVR